MYKKLFFLATLITSLVVISGLIGFQIINDADTVEAGQVKALTVLRNADHVYAHVSKLEKSAYMFLAGNDPALQTDFWTEYKNAVTDIDKQVIPLHNGDCKSCHKAFLSIGSEVKALRANLTLADNNGLAGGGKNLEYERLLQRNIATLERASIQAGKLAQTEEKNSAVATKKLRLKPNDNKRVIRAHRLVNRTQSIKHYIGILKEGIKKHDSARVQLGLNHLSELAQSKPVEPPLKGDCFSCHQSIAGLPKQAATISTSARQLFATAPASPARRLAQGKFDSSLKQFNTSILRILQLAREDSSRSMRKADAVRQQLKLFMIELDIAVVLAFITVAFILVRWVRKRLAAFGNAIETIAEGNYSYILSVNSNDEISELAHTFNLMVGKVRSSQETLASLNQELRELHLNTVKAFVEAIEAKDPYTRGHSENVARYSLLLGQELGFSIEELEELHVAALLHDIGKIGIREEILFKPSSLTDEEYKQIMAHPDISAQIVGSIPNLANIATMIRHHHEHYDGRGYTEGLVGESIPLGSRILAIADSFDAMTSDRPYRKGCGTEEALNEIKRCAGTQFDPALAEAFIKVMDNTDISDWGDILSIA